MSRTGSWIGGSWKNESWSGSLGWNKLAAAAAAPFDPSDIPGLVLELYSEIGVIRTQGSEIMVNGGMESGDPPTGYTNLDSSTFERSSVQKLSGAYSSHAVGPFDGAGFYQPPIGRIAGRTYKLKFSYFIVSGQIRVELENGVAGGYSFGPTTYTTTGSWQSVEATFVEGQTGDAGWLGFFADSGSAEFYIDAVSVVGVSVEQWTDQSGQGNHVTQTTEANKPLWVDAQINGYPAIIFDDINDILSNAVFSIGSNANGFSLFIVTKPTSTAAYGYLFSSPLSPGGFSVAQSDGSWRIGAYGVDVYDTGISCLDAYQLIRYECDIALQTVKALTTIDFARNGAAATSINNCDIGRGTGFDIGSVSLAPQPYGGGFAAILLYEPRLSLDNVQLVKTFLNTKYAIY